MGSKFWLTRGCCQRLHDCKKRFDLSLVTISIFTYSLWFIKSLAEAIVDNEEETLHHIASSNFFTLFSITRSNSSTPFFSSVIPPPLIR